MFEILHSQKILLYRFRVIRLTDFANLCNPLAVEMDFGDFCFVLLSAHYI